MISLLHVITYFFFSFFFRELWVSGGRCEGGGGGMHNIYCIVYTQYRFMHTQKIAEI